MGKAKYGEELGSEGIFFCEGIQSDGKKMVELSKEFSRIEPVVDVICPRR